MKTSHGYERTNHEAATPPPGSLMLVYEIFVDMC